MIIRKSESIIKCSQSSTKNMRSKERSLLEPTSFVTLFMLSLRGSSLADVR